MRKTPKNAIALTKIWPGNALKGRQTRVSFQNDGNIVWLPLKAILEGFWNAGFLHGVGKKNRLLD
jgi:hypothetical protein